MAPLLRILVDESVQKAVVDWLKQEGYDPKRVPASQGMDDDKVLGMAKVERRVLPTTNPGDFLRLDTQYRDEGREHCGIVMSAQDQNLKRFIRRVRRTLDGLTPEDMYNQVRWVKPAKVHADRSD